MYVKIYEQIFGSSIMEAELEVRYVWFCLLALADKNGFIDMTIPAIARRINATDSLVAKAIDLFCKPDVNSRNKSEDGRRLLPMRDSFGWQIVNYEHYRDLKDQNHRTEYMRDYMKLRRSKHDVNSSKLLLAALVPTTTDTTTNTIPPLPPKGRVSGFEDFWKAYPKRVAKGRAEKAWNSLRPNEQLQSQILAAIEQAKTSDQWAKDNGRYIPHPATWLNAKGWLDEEAEVEDGLKTWAERKKRELANAN